MASAVAVSAIACEGGPFNTVCTDELRYGLVVFVHDSATGAGRADGATVVVRDGAFVDSLTTAVGTTPTNGFISAPERAGTYTITVSRASYQTWTRSGVVVRKDRCHVLATTVTALLQP